MSGPETHAESSASGDPVLTNGEHESSDLPRTLTLPSRSGDARPPPQQLASGRFEILGTLGEGGMYRKNRLLT